MINKPKGAYRMHLYHFIWKIDLSNKIYIFRIQLMFKSIIHGRERKILRKNGLMLSLEADHDREIEKKESK